MSDNKIVSFWPKGTQFSDLLRMYRGRAGLSQSELASLLKLKNARMVQHWEKDILPRPSTLKKIIKLFLEQGVFIVGQELEEATHLWTVVKNNYEAGLNNYKTYEMLDRGWLEQLVRQYQLSADRVADPAQAASPGVSSAPPVDNPVNPEAAAEEETLPDPTPQLPVTLPEAPHNLPFRLTSFIGRTSQIQEIIGILAKNRFLTLVGPGGIGKTRLALEVARQVLTHPHFKDGAWLIELAALTDAQLVAQTILQSLGLDEESNRPPLATLTDYFKTKQALLILDNCEQLEGGCASLANDLLGACPGLRLLATSRMPLGLFGEPLWQVPSLSLPQPDEQERSYAEPDLTQYEAIQLFAERARTVWPGFSLQNQNLTALWELCHYLDGMPLAIELAAAWVNTLSLEQITARLHDSIRLLKTDSRVLIPPRQQTMHATIAWSYRLLSEAEQNLLKQLAIFAGGCTLNAVEAVCQLETDQSQVLDLLNLLIKKSLVVVDHQIVRKLGEVRYRLVETVRQYGLDQLSQDQAEYSTHQKRYANYYLQFVEAAELGLRGSQMELWLARLKAEYTNVRAVLGWSLEPENDEMMLAVRLVGALGWFWFTLSYIQEGRQWLDKILPRKAEVSWELLPKLLNSAATISFLQSELEEAAQFHREAVRLSREQGDLWEVGFSLGALAMQLAYRGRFEEAIKIARESLEVANQSGDCWLIIDQYFILIASLTHLGKLPEAADLAKECLKLSKKLGNKQLLGYAYLYVGKLYKAQKRLQQARTYLEDSLVIWRELGERRTALDAINDLALVIGAQGKYPQAEELLLDNLKQSREVGNPHLIALSLQALGQLSAETKNYEKATLYFEQSLTLFEEISDRRGQLMVSRALELVSNKGLNQTPE